MKNLKKGFTLIELMIIIAIIGILVAVFNDGMSCKKIPQTNKEVSAKYKPFNEHSQFVYIVAKDGTSCKITPIQFSTIEIGDTVNCQWRQENNGVKVIQDNLSDDFGDDDYQD